MPAIFQFLGTGGGGGEDLAATLALGNTTGANDIVVDSGQRIVPEYQLGAPTAPFKIEAEHATDATATGVGIELLAGNSGATLGQGGSILAVAGEGTGLSAGGEIRLAGGSHPGAASGDGGSVVAFGGYSFNGNGGSGSYRGGDSQNADGGFAELSGGDALGAGDAGYALITGGNSVSGPVARGEVYFRARGSVGIGGGLIPLNEAGQDDLAGYDAVSIIGALNQVLAELPLRAQVFS